MKELMILGLGAALVALAVSLADFGVSNIQDGGWNYSIRGKK